MKIKDPLLLNLPMPIYTKRLLIRPLMPGDGQQLLRLLKKQGNNSENGCLGLML